MKISSIQRFSVDDGPGIRTTVFLKGCNLRCVWCHNPENLTSTPSLQFSETACVKCGVCQQVCPNNVHLISSGQHDIHFDNCIFCQKCVNACYHNGLKIMGYDIDADSLLAEILKDKDFYCQSHGGVTFSGGEPMLQHKELKEILKLCKEHNLHTAVDTAGAVPYEYFADILPYTDLFLYDLKCFSNEIHKSCTGIDNKIILENIKHLGQDGASIIIRTPLIEGLNTDHSDLRNLAQFITSLKGIQLHQLLPYHNYGVGKYKSLGLAVNDRLSAPSADELDRIMNLFLREGIPSRIS